MELVFQADSPLDAHMIADLLNQQNIYSRIDGEALTGGIGEAQAMGLVRVYVNSMDYEQARSIIDAWEKHQPAEPSPRQQLMPRPVNVSLKTSFLFGLIIGVLLTLVFLR